MLPWGPKFSADGVGAYSVLLQYKLTSSWRDGVNTDQEDYGSLAGEGLVKRIYTDNISSARATLSAEASEFRKSGVATIRSLIKYPLVRALYYYSVARSNSGTMRSDSQVPGTPAAYADPAMEELLSRTQVLIENVAGVEVYPTYSYFRVYKYADVLPRHTDRPACELSLTVCLGYIPDQPWPIWVDAQAGPRSIALMPGDALLYRGTEIAHWRDSFEGTQAAQVFLHYVSKSGSHSGCRFDMRQNLSTLDRCGVGHRILEALDRFIKAAIVPS